MDEDFGEGPGCAGCALTVAGFVLMGFFLGAVDLDPVVMFILGMIVVGIGLTMVVALVIWAIRER